MLHNGYGGYDWMDMEVILDVQQDIWLLLMRKFIPCFTSWNMNDCKTMTLISH